MEDLRVGLTHQRPILVYEGYLPKPPSVKLYKAYDCIFLHLRDCISYLYERICAGPCQLREVYEQNRRKELNLTGPSTQLRVRYEPLRLSWACLHTWTGLGQKVFLPNRACSSRLMLPITTKPCR